MAEKNNVLDIVRGISSAVATAYDGALDEKGEPIKIGLSREEGNVILDKRIKVTFVSAMFMAVNLNRKSPKNLKISLPI